MHYIFSYCTHTLLFLPESTYHMPAFCLVHPIFLFLFIILIWKMIPIHVKNQVDLPAFLLSHFVLSKPILNIVLFLYLALLKIHTPVVVLRWWVIWVSYLIYLMLLMTSDGQMDIRKNCCQFWDKHDTFIHIIYMPFNRCVIFILTIWWFCFVSQKLYFLTGCKDQRKSGLVSQLQCIWPVVRKRNLVWSAWSSAHV